MSNWEDKTDDEINIAVTCHANNCYEWQFSESGKLFFHCGFDGGVYDSVDVVDYCNNPSDAWPIIADNNISIVKFAGFYLVFVEWEHVEFWLDDEPKRADLGVENIKGSDINTVCDKNPLRAAMIVYLEMNGVKP